MDARLVEMFRALEAAMTWRAPVGLVADVAIGVAGDQLEREAVGKAITAIEAHLREESPTPGWPEIVDGIIDRARAEMPVWFHEDHYGEYTIGAVAAFRRLRTAAYAFESGEVDHLEWDDSLPGDKPLLAYCPGDVVAFGIEPDEGVQFSGVVRRVCSWAVLVQSFLFLDMGAEHVTATGRLYAVASPPLIKPTTIERIRTGE